VSWPSATGRSRPPMPQPAARCSFETRLICRPGKVSLPAGILFVRNCAHAATKWRAVKREPAACSRAKTRVNSSGGFRPTAQQLHSTALLPLGFRQDQLPRSFQPCRCLGRNECQGWQPHRRLAARWSENRAASPSHKPMGFHDFTSSLTSFYWNRRFGDQKRTNNDV
jgi:hypothetical protein